MADSRPRMIVKIVDPVTNANEAGVNVNDNLQVVVNEALPAGANTIGAVNLAEHSVVDDGAVGVGGAVLMTGLVFDDTAPVVVEEGDAGYQRMSLNRNAYITIRDGSGSERGVNVTASNELNVLASAQPGVDIGDVTINGFTAAETDADDDVVAAAQTSLRVINLMYGFDGTQWERIQTNTTGAMDVNVVAGGGEALPINPVLTHGSTTDTAVGASANIDGPSSDSTTKTVRGFDASASVPIKAELIQVDNGIETIKVVVFGRAGEKIEWRAPHRDFLDRTFGANAGFDGFRVKLTNMDTSDAADLYATLYTED